MELLLKSYYNLVDDCSEYPLWVKKIEEDVGSVVAFMVDTVDESVRDELVASSPYFERFDLEK